jgi:hypothetical protein
VVPTAEQNEPAQRLFASVGFRRTMIEMTRELDTQAQSREKHRDVDSNKNPL